MSITQIAIVAAGLAALVASVYLARRAHYRHVKWTPSPAEAADFAAMQGIWHLLSTRREGTLGDGPPCLYVFDDDTVFVRPEGRQESMYSFWLDGTHHPKKLMLFARWPSGKVTSAEWAYELTPDELRWSSLGGRCPREMLPDDSPVGTVIKLRRASSRARGPRDAEQAVAG